MVTFIWAMGIIANVLILLHFLFDPNEGEVSEETKRLMWIIIRFALLCDLNPIKSTVVCIIGILLTILALWMNTAILQRTRKK